MPPSDPVTPPAGHKEVRVILPALLLVLIIGALYYWYAGKVKAPTAPAETASSTAATSTAAAPNVHVTQINLAEASTPTSKLPAGFPSDIPVEAANITQSYSAVYADHGVTQYTVNYTSAKTKDALWAAYTSYVSAAGYALGATTNKSEGVLDATKGKNDLNVLITSHNSTSLVQITYLARE
jgi:hypothetical protein